MLTVELQPRFNPQVKLVLMGVAGCGKSSVGETLAQYLHVQYLDGDYLHPVLNIKKMKKGIPLTDEDRWPWLTAVGHALARPDEPQIVGCSALKKIYRDHLRQIAKIPLLFVYLSGDMALIHARMQARSGHFMPVDLLTSQFAALEAPGDEENAITVDINQSLQDIVHTIISALKRRQQ